MGWFNGLEQLIGLGHPQAPVMAPAQQQNVANIIGNATHPMAMTMDPKYFGYPPDNTVHGTQQIPETFPLPRSLLTPMAHIQQLQLKEKVPLQGFLRQPQQWNSSMGGPAAGQNYMNSPSHAPIPSYMGNQYAQNPTDPQFVGKGVDPMIFGYPPDEAPQTPSTPFQQLMR